jgi:hypothetical protein
MSPRAMPRSLAGEAKVRDDQHVVVERWVLGEVADALADLGRLLEHVESRDAHRALGGRQEAGDDAHGGRLPGAVRAEETEDLPGHRRERHVLNGREVPVALRQVRDFDH